MAPRTCPTIDTLEQFLLGKLRGTKQAEVAIHLADCFDCGLVVETLSADDDLTLALSHHSNPAIVDLQAPQLARAIEFARELKDGCA